MPYKDINKRRLKGRKYYYKNRERKREYAKSKYHKCLNCDKLIVPKAKRCRSCYMKNRILKGFVVSKKVRKLSSERMKKNNPMKNPKISKKVRDSNKKNGSYEKHRINMINGGGLKARKGNNCKPNKPEKIIINLIKQYNLNLIYVGDGKRWFKGQTQYFNPDFINKEKKIIVEFFGDYWHNLMGVEEKDKERLKTYKKYGYDTLVIWEHELKNSSKLEIVNKINNFYKNG